MGGAAATPAPCRIRNGTLWRLGSHFTRKAFGLSIGRYHKPCALEAIQPAKAGPRAAFHGAALAFTVNGRSRGGRDAKSLGSWAG